MNNDNMVKVRMPSLVNTMSIRWRKELNMDEKIHVIVFIPCGSQHLAQWWQRCHELHHEYMCIRCHENNTRGEYPQGRWDVCTCTKGYLQLKDGVVQIAFEVLRKKLGKIIKRLGNWSSCKLNTFPRLEHDKI